MTTAGPAPSHLRAPHTDVADPTWRRGLRSLGVVCAAVVAAGMLSHLTPLVAGLVTLGLALWLVELLATPADPRLEALVLAGVGGCGALLNAIAPESPAFVLSYFAVAGLGLRFPVRTGLAVTLGVVVAVDLAIVDTSTQVLTSLTTSDLGLAFFFVLAAATRSTRAAQARTQQLLEELEESREAQAEAAALGERARLAREIHDILAHALSGQVMSLEATRMLAERTGADPRVVEEIARAHRLAKDGLADTRRAIGALRGDVLPGPDLLPRLVEDAQSVHGLRASYAVEGAPRPVPAEVGLTLYRAAQEALTNTAKHAGRGATTSLVLRWEPERVTLTASDVRRAGTPPAAELPSSGYGITGLRERAELAGGSLETAATADGFTVRLCLPLPDPGGTA